MTYSYCRWMFTPHRAMRTTRKPVIANGLITVTFTENYIMRQKYKTNYPTTTLTSNNVLQNKNGNFRKYKMADSRYKLTNYSSIIMIVEYLLLATSSRRNTCIKSFFASRLFGSCCEDILNSRYSYS